MLHGTWEALPQQIIQTEINWIQMFSSALLIKKSEFDDLQEMKHVSIPKTCNYFYDALLCPGD